MARSFSRPEKTEVLRPESRSDHTGPPLHLNQSPVQSLTAEATPSPGSTAKLNVIFYYYCYNKKGFYTLSRPESCHTTAQQYRGTEFTVLRP